MSAGLILAIDQGTTNTKALLVDRAGVPVFRASTPAPLLVLQDGRVEQEPLALWDSVLSVIASSTAFTGERGLKIDALALTNQRETALAWNAETGEPLAPAIGWQCNRSSLICDRLAPQAAVVREKTGLPLAPLISAGKWAWLLENDDAVRAAGRTDVLRFGTVDSWLIHRLTGGAAYVTDLTNASRTGLLNLDALDWDAELLRLFGIPRTALPALKPSSGLLGTCRAVAEVAGVPILSAIGDSHAAMFGHGRFSPGSVKATYGTGSSLMALCPALPGDTPTLARTIAWSIAGQAQFALEGNIAMTGSAVQWLGEFLGFPDPAADVARLAATVDDAAGVYFVPAMVGLGAPYWNASARGSITGLGRHHHAGHLARAALDAIAYQVADVFFAMQAASGIGFDELRADGGASRNGALMQFQADLLGCPVLRARNEELSAIGAAMLAGLSLGWWSSLPELASLTHDTDAFSPMMQAAARNSLYAGWKTAVASVCNSSGSTQ
ncbi:MAG: glycerol kinase GlpK [Terracidiphilus sp.]